MNNKELNPSNFTKFPFSSKLYDSNSETIALNIMKILKRTGDKFRKLSFEEYKEERIKDGNFSDKEEFYFNEVINYCDSAENALLFCENWIR